MEYWLTVLGLISAIKEDNESRESTSCYNPEQIEFHCHNRILSALPDRLCDIYQNIKSAKELWKTLEEEYGIDNTGVDRFIALTINKYVMVDEKSMNEQIHQFQDLQHVEEIGSSFSEDYKVSCLIDKL